MSKKSIGDIIERIILIIFFIDIIIGLIGSLLFHAYDITAIICLSILAFLLVLSCILALVN